MTYGACSAGGRRAAWCRRTAPAAQGSCGCRRGWAYTGCQESVEPRPSWQPGLSRPAGRQPRRLDAPSCSVIWLDSDRKVALFMASLPTVRRMFTTSLARICRRGGPRRGAGLPHCSDLYHGCRLQHQVAAAACCPVSSRPSPNPATPTTLHDTMSLRLAASLISFSAFFCSRCTSAGSSGSRAVGGGSAQERWLKAQIEIAWRLQALALLLTHHLPLHTAYFGADLPLPLSDQLLRVFLLLEQ